MSRLLVSLFIILSGSLVYAHEPEDLKKLSQQNHWLKLLHFSERVFSSSKSDVSSKIFFLSPDGQSNAEAELLATIKGISESEDIYCRFPARRIWLEDQGLKFPQRKCTSFDEWTRGNSVKSVSLVFASGYLGNPASYFGHPLLKFNFKDARSPLDLLDTAINYGAFTPPDVAPLPYAILGIFGGYEAGFTSTDFFFHKNNYSELELRDLWEYELKLNEREVLEAVAHIWEMKDVTIPYFFFNDNCAYRMGEFLELITGKEFVSNRSPVAIPANLFHKLHEYDLFTEIKLLSSRQTRLREKVISLNSKERTFLKSISENSDKATSDEFKALSESEKSRVLEAAMDYFSYRFALDNKNNSLKEDKRKVVQQRLTLPPKKENWEKLPQRPPHEAQRPVLTQFGTFYSDKFEWGGSLRVRPVFYDLISPDTARPVLSSLSVFDVELNFTEEQLWLKSFNLIALESLNISKTGLHGDGGWAWKFKLGADQMNLACNTCTVPRFEGGFGKAFEISQKFVVSGMIDPRIQSTFQGSGFLAVTPNISALMTFSKDFRISASGGRRYYLNHGFPIENIYSIEGRLGSSRTWDLRMGYMEHVDKRYSLALGLYW